jgi:hypothetical protein
MRKTIYASMFAVAAFTLGSEARAQANLHSGDVLRPGDNMLYGEVGWPELAFGFQHGMTDKVDLGFRFSFIYGWEYWPVSPSPLGLGMRVPIRITPVRTGRVSFQIHFDPGLKFDSFGNRCGVVARGYFCDNFAGAGLEFGLWLAFGLEVGIHLTRDATLSFGMEAPFYVNFTNGVYGGLPILFGPGFEYHIDDHMSVGMNLKLGPSIIAASYTDQFGNTYTGTNTYIGLIALPYFAYRL